MTEQTNKTNNIKKKIAISLVYFSVFLGVVIWFYFAYWFEGSPEEEMWAPIAGFFMGLIIGGVLLILSIINLIVVSKKKR